MRRIYLLLTLALVGCGDSSVFDRGPLATSNAGSLFEPATASTVAGTVRWKGEPPTVDGFRSIDDPFTDQLPPKPREWPNPHAPRLDSRTGGLEGIVVYLKGIDPKVGRPWDHPPVTIAMSEQLTVIQGKERERTGFVQTGQSIRVVRSRDVFASVKGRGAACFTLTLPRRDEARTWCLEKPGVVELSSGTGQFWMRTTLFVDNHPYYARTDNKGRFTLKQVPPGTYTLIAWMPNWRTASIERQPDSYRIIRLEFKKALQTSKRITVMKGTCCEIDLELGESDVLSH